MTRREKELDHQLQQCQQALLESRRENVLLRQKIDLLIKRVFGSSSEQLNPAQLELLMPVPESSAVTATAPPPEKERSAKPVRKRVPRLPENLPVVEEVIDPEPVKAQPEQWRCIGQEVSEQLDYEPGRFLRRRVVRRKYVHKTNPDCCARHRRPAGTVAGSQSARAGIAGPHRGGKILRPSSPLPAGTDLPATPRSQPATAEFDPLGGAGFGMVETHL